MRIPSTTKKPRWYVALSITEAVSSWGSLLKAQESLSQIVDGHVGQRQIKGIVENGPHGPRFVFFTRFPINENDDWVGSDPPLLRSEIVYMCRYQLQTRDRWLSEMDSLPVDRQDFRRDLLAEYSERHLLAEKVIAEQGHLFPEE